MGWHVFRSFCAMVVVATAAFAQTEATTGRVTGRVADESNLPVPGAIVRIWNEQTGFSRDVVTDTEGLYSAPQLPAGTYELEAKLQGFRSARAHALAVTVGSSLTVNLTLPAGSVDETVIVVASPVDTAAVARSSTLDARAIENVAINGRRFQDLVVLTPTAQVDTSRGQISLSGQRGINTNISIDGADYNQPFFGGIRGGERSNNAPTVPQSAIQEFQVVASGYSAEYGRSSGGVVNVLTKSGGNTFAGSAFYVNRYKDWANKNVFGQAAAPTQQQFGAGGGGPLKRNSTFFFVAVEQQQVSIPRAVLFDTLPVAPNADGTEAFNYYKSLEVPYTQTNDGSTWLVRVDQRVGNAARLNIRYSGSTNTGENGTSVGNPLFPTVSNALSNNGTEEDRTHSAVGQWSGTRGPGLLYEIRAQYSREIRPRLANDIAPNVTTNVGRYGTVNFLPTTQNDSRTQAGASMTRLVGRHSMKAGVEYNQTFAHQFFAFNQFGVYSVSGTNTTTILELMSLSGATPNRFDNTTATYLRQTGNGELEMTVNEGAAFVADTWRVRSNVTIDYGLRWDGQWNPTPATSNTALVNSMTGVVFPSGRSVDPSQIPDAPNQWGPRLGFSWDPRGDAQTVLRGFTGMYYARTPMILLAAPMNNFRTPAGDLSVQLPFTVPSSQPAKTIYQQMKLIGVDLNTSDLAHMPDVTPSQIQEIAGALGIPFDPNNGLQPIAVDRNFKNPRATQVGAGVERALTAAWTVTADWSQVRTVNLERNRDLNVPLPVVRANDPAARPFFGLRSGTARPIASLGSVQVRESSARSRFDALTLGTRFRRSRGELNMYYVLSRSLSDDDNERDAGGASAESPLDDGPEYNYARLDRRHQFSGTLVAFLPFTIQAATGFQARSGVPIDAAFGSDANEDRGGPDRPFSAPGVPFKRNAFRNRAAYDVSLHVQKDFSLSRERSVGVVLDVFNLFDFANLQYAGSQVTNYCAAPVPADCGFTAPTNPNFLQLRDQDPASARFGQYLLNNNPGDPRQVQLGVRFKF